jgi:hypothetical protein
MKSKCYAIIIIKQALILLRDKNVETPVNRIAVLTASVVAPASLSAVYFDRFLS